MKSELFERFAPAIRELTEADLGSAAVLRDKLRIARAGAIEVCYAPFEYVNTEARLVLVGITPGMRQMTNAVREARRQLLEGAGFEQALRAAKRTGAFSGSMRPTLVQLLDHVGVNELVGVSSCDALFGSAAHLLQTASVLRNAVFVGGEDYNGAPNMLRHPLLREQLLSGFAEDARQLERAVFVPLGRPVPEALEQLPHPSGANAERTAYFLGRKSRSALSGKTNPDKLDEAQEALRRQVAQLRLHVPGVTQALRE